MGVVLAAGGSFQWFRNELGKAEVALAKQRGEDPYFLLTRRGRAGRSRGRGAVLPALPDRRAHAALRPRRQGRLDRPDRPARPPAPDPQRARRGDLRHARQPGADPRDGRGDRAGARLRRRRPQPALAADPGRHLRLRRAHAQLERGAGLRRRPAGPGRHRRLRLRPRGVRRHHPRRRVHDRSTPKVRPFYDRAYAIYRQLYLDLRQSFRSISALVERPGSPADRDWPVAEIERQRRTGCGPEDETRGATPRPLRQSRRAERPRPRSRPRRRPVAADPAPGRSWR